MICLELCTRNHGAFSKSQLEAGHATWQMRYYANSDSTEQESEHIENTLLLRVGFFLL